MASKVLAGLDELDIVGTPQSKKADKRQKKNNAGGFTFTLDPADQLRRFLILGVDSGTYYQSSKELAIDNAKIVVEMAEHDHENLLRVIEEVSVNGLAPRQDPTLFALAIAASAKNDAARKGALELLPRVARTSTHLFLFAKYVNGLRGWGRGLRTAVGHWYNDKDVDKLAYQAVKYRQREGWTHRDMLRLAHPATEDAQRAQLFNWMAGRNPAPDLKVVQGYELAKEGNKTDWLRAINDYGVPWEGLPDAALKEVDVWRALLSNDMPMTAMIRQLSRMTKLGVFTNGKKYVDIVVKKLGDQTALHKSRVHPLQILLAMTTYQSGRSPMRGFYYGGASLDWTPVKRIVNALDKAFYDSFKNVESTGKRVMLALDCSGSMGQSIAGTQMTAIQGAVAMSMVTEAVEDTADVYGFASGSGGRWRGGSMKELNVTSGRRLDDNVKTALGLNWGGTDCAAPTLYALDKGLVYDTFVVYTDNETWAGSTHPHEALKQYRKKVNPEAKLIVVGMTATEFTIADPSDAGMMDVVGFDASAPAVMSDFMRT